jgi:hypothetical protein
MQGFPNSVASVAPITPPHSGQIRLVDIDRPPELIRSKLPNYQQRPIRIPIIAQFGIKTILAARGKSRAIAACVFGPASSVAKLARILVNTVSFRRLESGPNPRRIGSRDFCHRLLPRQPH